ncbi:MAG: biopolymer transporter ExbD [Caulobacterales bacterium]
MGAKLASSGGGKSGRREMAPNSDPNVIPFIDILLVLLIIFMVTAPIPTVDIRVDLPPPNPRPMPPIEGRKPTFVLMDSNFRITVDGEQATIETVGDVVLRKAIENNWSLPITQIYSDATVYVRADQSAPYGEVVRLMSRLQEEGFVKVGIFAELAQEG